MKARELLVALGLGVDVDDAGHDHGVVVSVRGLQLVAGQDVAPWVARGLRERHHLLQAAHLDQRLDGLQLGAGLRVLLRRQREVLLALGDLANADQHDVAHLVVHGAHLRCELVRHVVVQRHVGRLDELRHLLRLAQLEQDAHGLVELVVAHEEVAHLRQQLLVLHVLEVLQHGFELFEEHKNEAHLDSLGPLPALDLQQHGLLYCHYCSNCWAEIRMFSR